VVKIKEAHEFVISEPYDQWGMQIARNALERFCIALLVEADLFICALSHVKLDCRQTCQGASYSSPCFVAAKGPDQWYRKT